MLELESGLRGGGGGGGLDWMREERGTYRMMSRWSCIDAASSSCRLAPLALIMGLYPRISSRRVRSGSLLPSA